MSITKVNIIGMMLSVFLGGICLFFMYNSKTELNVWVQFICLCVHAILFRLYFKRLINFRKDNYYEFA